MKTIKPAALVLSGGGAKGAFEVAAEKYARETHGYQWTVIAGVSVGALNGAMLSQEAYAELEQLWNELTFAKIYSGGADVATGVKLLFGSRGVYGNGPIKKLMHQVLDPARMKIPLRIGAVNLRTGQYLVFGPDHPNFLDLILASSNMPIVAAPVHVDPDLDQMADGGVAHTSPLGDVLDTDPA